MFRARYNNDFKTLRALYLNRVAFEDYTTALLCFHCGDEFGRKLSRVFDRQSGRLPHSASYLARKISPNPLNYMGGINATSVSPNNRAAETYSDCHFVRSSSRE